MVRIINQTKRKIMMAKSRPLVRPERLPVMIVNGAVREGGSTDAVTRALAAGFRAAGAQIRTVNLRELQIADCLGCRQCRDDRICYFTDDMNRLRPAVMTARLIVLASPLYFCGVTGLMKSFLDRLYFFYHDVNRHLVAGKKVVIATTLGEKQTRFEMAPLVEFYRRYLRALRLRRIGLLTYLDLMEKDSIKKHPEYLGAARVFAQRLGRRLSADRCMTL